MFQNKSGLQEAATGCGVCGQGAAKVTHIVEESMPYMVKAVRDVEKSVSFVGGPAPITGTPVSRVEKTTPIAEKSAPNANEFAPNVS